MRGYNKPFAVTQCLKQFLYLKSLNREHHKFSSSTTVCWGVCTPPPGTTLIKTFTFNNCRASTSSYLETIVNLLKCNLYDSLEAQLMYTIHFVISSGHLAVPSN
uniref:Uncharacterized protein n=1 Tax=Cyclophora tenuis TaxID=216820 RepID=A0A7S1D897_CYCTE